MRAQATACPRLLENLQRGVLSLRPTHDRAGPSRRKGDMFMLQAVLFDMDGVLIDSEPIHKDMYLEVAEELGCQDAHRHLDFFIGRSSLALWEHTVKTHGLSGDPKEYSDLQMRRYRDFLKANQGWIDPARGIPELLADLVENNVRIALASSNTRRNVDFVLKYFGMHEIFDATISGEDGAACKPAPDIFLLAAERMGVDPARCVVIEDAQSGVAAAKAAGMRCAAIENPNSGAQDLSLADLRTPGAYALSFKLLDDLVAGRLDRDGK